MVLVLVVLFYKGGVFIYGFVIVLLFGVVVGIYLLVYIVSLVVFVLGISKEDLMLL